MARLPLIINDQRLKTLEGLRENFNLTELLERFRGGQLRAWLYNWDYDSELEQVEALSPDLPELELLEALCRIFGVEGDAKEQALAAFTEEQEKREEEAKRRKEQQEAEERAKTSIAKPLTLDEIEFDWQENITPDNREVLDIVAGEDRFVSISDQYNTFYSYDGISWEHSNIRFEGFSGPTFRGFTFTGEYYIAFEYTSYRYSKDAINWSDNIIIDDELSFIKKILWTGNQYVALGVKFQDYSYSEKSFFRTKTKYSNYPKPVIYVSNSIVGPWHKETIGDYRRGDELRDIVVLNGSYLLGGGRSAGFVQDMGGPYETVLYSGDSFANLKRNVVLEQDFGWSLDRFYRYMNGCFWCQLDGSSGYFDGKHWNKGSLPDSSLRTMLVTDLFIVTWCANSIQVSVDGKHWKKVISLPSGLYQHLAWLRGKLLIVNDHKIVIGTLKIAHKDNTSSCSTQSGNTSTEDRDLHYNVELNAEEAKTGTIKEVTVTRSETCSLCSGSGRESGTGERSCTNCNGCGLVQGSKSIKVRIPADVKSGAKLRVRGQGNAGRGEAQPGDLYVHITVREESSIPPSQTNSVDHTAPLKEIADAMNPLKNPSVLISPTDSIAKLVATRLKSNDNILELIETKLKSGIISEEGKNK